MNGRIPTVEIHGLQAVISSEFGFLASDFPEPVEPQCFAVVCSPLVSPRWIDNRTFVRYNGIDLGVLDAIGNPSSRLRAIALALRARLRATALALRARPNRVRTR